MTVIERTPVAESVDASDALPMSHDDISGTSDTAGGSSADVLASLVANHREFLAFLERRVASRAVAEDILQEAFARGLDRLDTVRDGESVVAWFYRVLRNAVIDHHRRQGSAARALGAFAQEVERAEATAPPDVGRAVCQCVGRLASTLKPEYADALRRIEIDQVPVHEFAEEQGISKGNAAVRVFRAREALRRRVVASCGTCAEHGCVDCTCRPPAA